MISWSRIRSAAADWSNVPNWSGGSTYQTPSLTAIVKEIVDRSGELPGQAFGQFGRFEFSAKLAELLVGQCFARATFTILCRARLVHDSVPSAGDTMAVAVFAEFRVEFAR